MADITNKYKVEDKQVAAAIKAVEQAALEGKKGNFEVKDRGITKNDAGSMVEGKRYIDAKNNRMVVKIGGKLYKTDMEELL